MPPAPAHGFDINYSWLDLSLSELPVFDQTSRPFWTRLNNFCPYLTPMCSSCNSSLKDVLYYQVNPTVDSIPTSPDCICAEIRPLLNKVPPLKAKSFQYERGVIRTYASNPTIFLHLPFKAATDIGMGDKYPLGKKMVLTDAFGIPSFSQKFATFPSDGVGPYLLGAQQFCSWTLPYVPKGLIRLYDQSRNAIKDLYAFTDGHTYANYKFTSCLIVPPKSKEQNEVYRVAVQQRVAHRQQLYQSVIRCLKTLFDFAFNIYHLSNEIYSQLRPEWSNLQCYFEEGITTEWHPDYVNHADQTLCQISYLLMKVQNLDPICISMADEKILEGLLANVDAALSHSFFTGTSKAKAFQILDEIFERVYTDIMMATAKIVHFFTRTVKRYFLAAHCYSACYHAMSHPELMRITTLQIPFDPWDSVNGKHTIKQITLEGQTLSPESDTAASHMPLQRLYPSLSFEMLHESDTLPAPYSPALRNTDIASQTSSSVNTITTTDVQNDSVVNDDAVDVVDGAVVDDSEVGSEGVVKPLPLFQSQFLGADSAPQAQNENPTTFDTREDTISSTVDEVVTQTQKPEVPSLHAARRHLTPDYIVNGNLIVRKHPWIKFSPGRDWKFNECWFPTELPLDLCSSETNDCFPRLPLYPPKEFQPREEKSVRASRWNRVRTQVGAVCVRPHYITSECKQSFVRSIQKEFEAAPPFEIFCWYLERTRRPVAFSSDNKFHFAEDFYPVIIPAYLASPTKNPDYPFLPATPPPHFKVHSEDRVDSWTRLCARFGSIFNLDQIELLKNESAICSFYQYQQYEERKKTDPFHTPQRFHHLFIPITKEWIFNSEGVPLGIMEAYAAGLAEDPLPRPIPATAPPQFLPQVRFSFMRHIIWDNLGRTLTRLQALGFPRRSELIRIALQSHQSVESNDTHSFFTYQRIKHEEVKSQSQSVEHIHREPKALPLSYSPEIGDLKMSNSYPARYDQKVRAMTQLMEDQLSITESIPVIQLTPTATGDARRIIPVTRHKEDRPPKNSIPTTMMFLLVAMLLLPLAMADSLVLKNGFIYNPKATNVHLNPTYHVIARRIDISMIPNFLATANYMLEGQQRLCKKFSAEGAFTQYVIVQNVTTCKHNGMQLPNPKSLLEMHYFLEFFEASRINKAFFLASITPHDLRIGNSVIQIPQCRVLQKKFLLNKGQDIKALFLIKEGPTTKVCGMTHGYEAISLFNNVICEKPDATFREHQGVSSIYAQACRDSLQSSVAQISHATNSFHTYAKEMKFPKAVTVNQDLIYTSNDGQEDVAPKRKKRMISMDYFQPVHSHSVNDTLPLHRRRKRAVPFLAAAGLTFAGMAGLGSITSLINQFDLHDEIERLAKHQTTLMLADRHLASRLDDHIANYNNLTEYLESHLASANDMFVLNFLSDAISDLTNDVLHMVAHLGAIISAAASGVVYPTILTTQLLSILNTKFHRQHKQNLVTDISTVQIHMAKSATDYFAIMKIPVYDSARLATIFEVTPVPMWRQGVRFSPKAHIQHLAILEHGFHYVEMSPHEFEQCQRHRTPCMVSQPILDAQYSACGGINYHRTDSSCVYTPDSEQTDFFAIFGNVTVFSVKQAQYLHIKCFDPSKNNPSYNDQAQISGIGSTSIAPQCTATTADGRILFSSDPNENEVELLRTYVIKGRSSFHQNISLNMHQYSWDKYDLSSYRSPTTTLEDMPTPRIHSAGSQIHSYFIWPVFGLLAAFATFVMIMCFQLRKLNKKRKSLMKRLTSSLPQFAPPTASVQPTFQRLSQPSFENQPPPPPPPPLQSTSSYTDEPPYVQLRAARAQFKPIPQQDDVRILINRIKPIGANADPSSSPSSPLLARNDHMVFGSPKIQEMETFKNTGKDSTEKEILDLSTHKK